MSDPPKPFDAAKVVREAYARYPKIMEALRQSELAEGAPKDRPSASNEPIAKLPEP